MRFEMSHHEPIDVIEWLAQIGYLRIDMKEGNHIKIENAGV